MVKRPIYIIKKSDKPEKKYVVITPEGKKIYFGQNSYNDFIIWNVLREPDEAKKRKELYIARHKKNEDWTKSGIESPGFWSRYILWNQDTFKKSVEDVQRRFNIIIN